MTADRKALRREQVDQFMDRALDNVGAFDHSNDEDRDRAYVRAMLDKLLERAVAAARAEVYDEAANALLVFPLSTSRDELARHFESQAAAALAGTSETTEDPVRTLATEIHEAWEFQYSECDHGTYSGGPSHGQPYAMCELIAEYIVARRPAVLAGTSETTEADRG